MDGLNTQSFTMELTAEKNVINIANIVKLSNHRHTTSFMYTRNIKT